MAGKSPIIDDEAISVFSEWKFDGSVSSFAPFQRRYKFISNFCNSMDHALRCPGTSNPSKWLICVVLSPSDSKSE